MMRLSWRMGLLTWASILLSVFAFAQEEKAEGLFKDGQARYQRGDYQAAVAAYTAAIAADPTYLQAYMQRAFCYSVLKKYREAVADYDYVISQKPGQAALYISRGSAYNKLEQYKKALVDFNQALSLDPENQEAFNNRGWAKQALGDHEGACADWKRSKKLGNKEAKIILQNTKCK